MGRSCKKIRLRVNEPFLLLIGGKRVFSGGGWQDNRKTGGGLHCHSGGDPETLEYVSSYSLYAFSEVLRQGFLTVPGGHRVGVAGRTILEGEKIRGMQHISYLNIRISHEKKDVPIGSFPMYWKRGRVHHTLLIAPPRCGKTTILRDLIRQISNGTEAFGGCTVGA